MSMRKTPKKGPKSAFATNQPNGLVLNKKNLRKFKDIAQENVYVEFLYLRENEFLTFDPYILLERLKLLDLSINSLTKCDFLPNTPNIRHLYLTGNRISTLQGIRSLLHLETLCMSDNQVSNFEGLEDLPNLRVLSLNYNNIADFNAYPYLPSLHTLNLVSNPVAALPTYRQMAIAASNPGLVNIDGEPIEEDEKEAIAPYRGKIVYCIAEGWVLEGNQPEESAEKFLLTLQRNRWKSKALQLQSIALVSGESNNIPTEGQPLGLSICMQDVRPLATRQSDIFFSQFLFPVAFKVSGDASEVFVVGQMNRWTDPIPLERCVENEEVCFQTTLYLPAGDYEYRYIVDGTEKITDTNKTTSKFNQGICNIYHVSANTVRDDDQETSLCIRWMRSNEASGFDLIQEENGLSYTPKIQDIGCSVRAEVLAYDKGNFSFLYFDISTPISAAPPTIANLDLTGVVAEGESLALSYEYFGGDEGQSEIRWFRVMADDTEAEIQREDPFADLQLDIEDIGRRVRVQVTPIRADWVAGQSMSKTTTIVTAGVPQCRAISIVGENEQDTTLTAETQYSGGHQGHSKYQWFRLDESVQPNAWDPIPGETKKTYLLGLPDVNKKISVEYTPVSREDVEGNPVRCVLEARIKPAPPKIRSILMRGQLEEGCTLSIEFDYHGGHHGDHDISWLRRKKGTKGGGLPIGRPNAKTYTLMKDDVDHFIDVRVWPQRDDGVHGEIMTVSSDEPIKAGLPQLLSFAVVGKPEVGAILEIVAEYSGGIQGKSIIEWARGSPDSREFERFLEHAKKCVVQRQDAGKILRVSYTPVRNDGMQGKMNSRMIPIPEENEPAPAPQPTATEAQPTTTEANGSADTDIKEY